MFYPVQSKSSTVTQDLSRQVASSCYITLPEKRDQRPFSKSCAQTAGMSVLGTFSICNSSNAKMNWDTAFGGQPLIFLVYSASFFCGWTAAMYLEGKVLLSGNVQRTVLWVLRWRFVGGTMYSVLFI